MAADLRVARRDGRRVGALRGLGAAAARRHRHRARVRVGPGRPQRVAARDAHVAARPVLPRAARRRLRVPVGAAGAGRARRDRPHRTRPRRDRRALAPRRQGNPERRCVGRLHRRRSARQGLRRRAAARARHRPAGRRRGRGRARRRRPGRDLVERPGVDRAASTTASTALPGRARPLALAVDHDCRASGPGSATAASRSRSSPRLHVRRAVLADALGLGADVSDQPVGRRARRQPDDGHRPRPHRRSVPPRERTRQATRARRTRRSGPCLQQNLVCVLEAR